MRRNRGFVFTEMSLQTMLRISAIMVAMLFQGTAFSNTEKINPDNCQNDVWLKNMDKNKLSVAIRHLYSRPFIFEDPVGDLTGLSWMLWRKIDREIKKKNPEFDYFVVCLSIDEGEDNIEHGKLDVIISPLTVTDTREQKFNFSHQYMNSKLVIAYNRPDSEFDFKAALSTLGSVLDLNRFLILLGIFITLCGGLFILTLKNIEDYQSASLANRSKFSTIFHVMVSSVLNTAGIRQDVFAFTRTGMQIFSILILIFGITLSASFFSMLTAALTKSVNASHEYTVSDLAKHKIITYKKTTSEQFLRTLNIPEKNLLFTDSWLEALQALQKNEDSLLVGDWLQLLYLSNLEQFANNIIVQDTALQFEPYGFGLRNDLPWRDDINREMIKFLRNPDWTKEVKDVFGEQVL